jgi:hypothetical protein
VLFFLLNYSPVRKYSTPKLLFKASSYLSLGTSVSKYSCIPSVYKGVGALSTREVGEFLTGDPSESHAQAEMG